MPPQKQIESKSFQKTDPQVELNAILSRPLVPDTIDTFADEAIDQLVSFTDRIVKQHKVETATLSTLDAQSEDEAFSAYGLGNISQILDHITQKSTEIKQLSTIIDNAEIMSEVITPPDVLAAMAIISGGGTFERPITIPRLKTLLFILENDYDINLHDPESFHLTKGVLKDGMMRRESYYAVETPALERTTLVCDEEGNATFVFDDVTLAESTITLEDLVGLTKQEIKELIEAEPKLGKRIVYSDKFVENITNAYENIPNTLTTVIDEVPIEKALASNYLYPKKPDDYTSVTRMSDDWNVSPQTIKKAINDIPSEVLGPIDTYKYHAVTSKFYSPEQAQLLYDYLEANELILDAPPEGYISISGLALEMRTTQESLKKLIKTTEPENFGQIGRYKSGSVVAEFYSPSQQQTLYDLLTNGGQSPNEIVPEGYVTLGKLGLDLNSDREVVIRTIKAIGESFGELRAIKIGASSTKYVSPEQAEMIRSYLTERGFFTEQAPEGYMSIGGMANLWGVSHNALKSALAETIEHDSFGEIRRYRFGSMLTDAFSETQQAAIRQTLTDRDLFQEPLPEGYLSIAGMSRELGVDFYSTKNAVDDLGDKLTGIKSYKFPSGRSTPAYSPEQTEMVRRQLESKGFFIEKPPEGYYSISGMTKIWNVADKTVVSAIKFLQENYSQNFGEPTVYKFGSRPNPGYSPEQVEMIRQTLEDRGRFAPLPPEGYHALEGLGRIWGVHPATIQKSINELGEELGEVNRYRFTTTAADAYSPEQQALIKTHLDKVYKTIRSVKI